MIDTSACIVIICYNQARYLRESIATAVQQSCPAKEVIVVDDGSSDETPEVARSWPQVRYIRRRNGGPSAARNTGLHEATGQFVLFLDADDRLLPTAVEEGVRAFCTCPSAAFVYGGYSEMDEAGQFLWSTLPDPSRTGYVGLLKGNHIAMQAAVLYRAQVLKDCGGFDERLRACEDYELYLRLARAHATVAYSKVVAEYRRHASNATGNPGGMLRAAMAVLRRHRPAADAPDEVRSAYVEGCTFWREYYGERLVAQLRRQVQKRQPLRALASLATGLHHDPNFGVRIARRTLRPSGATRRVAAARAE